MDYKLNNHIVCGALFLGLFFLLLPLAAQGPQYFDGAEYAAAAISNSIVHQPGYPWFMLINHFLVKIFSDNPYHTIAIFSLACHILAGYLIFLSYKFLKLSSVIAVLAGTSFIFFSDALKIAPDTEVFGFHHLLISATFYLALKFYYLPNNKWRAISLGLVYGIACAHHQTSILWAPFGLALLFSKGLKTNLLALVLGATLGFSGNLLLFTVNDSWVYLAPDSIAELTHFLLRSDYGTFSLFSGQAATTFSTLPHFLFAVCTELPAFVLLLISLVISLFVKRSALSIGLTMTFVLHLWFIAQFNFPSLHPIIIEFASRAFWTFYYFDCRDRTY